ncbi:MAG TPA: IS110 family transposase [Candidatus Competibacteraceae bacterium]|nr:IS110 family transposase [Candidatus Competibacteraceae bacterium]
MNVIRIGLDIAKQVFQIHGVDTHGKVVLRQSLSRGKVLAFFANLPACLIGLEAGGGAHYWGRELTRLGHEVRLIAPPLVVPYRKSGKAGKNDKNDAEAICEAVGRPSMRFVPIKSEDQQAVLMLHRARELAVTERTALVNQIRGLLGEFGIVVAQGRERLQQALPLLLEDAENGLPLLARETFAELAERLRIFDHQITAYDRRLEQLAREREPARRLMTVDGVGPITATAVVATLGDGLEFRNGRQFAAWLGLTPRQYSSGGKTKLGSISKRGNSYLRTLLIHGARAVLRLTARRTDQKSRWAEAVKARRGENIAAIALAAKHARILWAMVTHGEEYRLAA